MSNIAMHWMNIYLKRNLKMQKQRYQSLSVDEIFFFKNVQALTEMRDIFSPFLFNEIDRRFGA